MKRVYPHEMRRAVCFSVLAVLLSVADAAGFGMASTGAAASTYVQSTFACPQPTVGVVANATHVALLVSVSSARSGDAGATTGRTPFAYVTRGPKMSFVASSPPGSAENPALGSMLVPDGAFMGTCSLQAAGARYGAVSEITKAPVAGPRLGTLSLNASTFQAAGCRCAVAKRTRSSGSVFFLTAKGTCFQQLNDTATDDFFFLSTAPSSTPLDTWMVRQTTSVVGSCSIQTMYLLLQTLPSFLATTTTSGSLHIVNYTVIETASTSPYPPLFGAGIDSFDRRTTTQSVAISAAAGVVSATVSG